MHTDQPAQPGAARAAAVTWFSCSQVRPPGCGQSTAASSAGGEHVEVCVQPPGRGQAGRRGRGAGRGELGRGGSGPAAGLPASRCPRRRARPASRGPTAMTSAARMLGRHAAQPGIELGVEQPQRQPELAVGGLAGQRCARRPCVFMPVDEEQAGLLALALQRGERARGSPSSPRQPAAGSARGPARRAPPRGPPRS